MKETADYLRDVLAQVEPLLRNLDDTTSSLKSGPQKWSPKQVIGHLIDSANNNQMKFTKLISHNNINVVGYQQDEWVAAQNYQAYDWQTLLNLWRSLNLHIVHIIEHTPNDALNHEISVNGIGPFKLDFIMNDYVEHLKHHINQALPSANLGHNFKKIY
ncbi:MAG: hypothetical protein ACI9IP_001995 [Arcticibacterium sp.]|jgi:hypothetical protein